MNREQVIEKIKKLYSLSGNNPSVNEATAAALMAQRLMHKYHIEELDLAESAEELMELVTNEFENLRSKGFITQAEFAKSVTDSRLKGLTPQRIQPLLNKLVAKNVLIKSTSKNTPVYTIG